MDKTNNLTLDKLKIGESGVVKLVLGEGKIRRRLFDMGLTPGANIYLRKVAPLGDPIEITIRGYELTLRRAEASYIVIDRKDEVKRNEKNCISR